MRPGGKVHLLSYPTAIILDLKAAWRMILGVTTSPYHRFVAIGEYSFCLVGALALEPPLVDIG
jgi:hypothetical protein